jgi:hypothetical protein
LVAPYAAGHDIAVVRRDLVTASPLERRYGERIRFAHRSFQEFLVAEEVLRRIRSGKMSVSEYDSLATPEVAAFVKLLRRDDDDPTLSALVRDLSGPLSWQVADSLLASPGLVRDLELRITGEQRGQKPLGGWEILLPLLHAIDGRAQTSLGPVDLAESARLSQDGSEGIALLCLFLAGCLASVGLGGGKTPAISEILSLLLRGQRGTRELAKDTDFGESFAGRRRRRRPDDPSDSELWREGRLRSRSAAAERSAYDYQFADDRMPFVPLGESFVGDARGANADSRRLGRYVTRPYLFQTFDKPTLESLAIRGGQQVDIRWLPQPVIEIAQVLRGCKTVIDMRSLGSIFATHLPEVAFIREWTGTSGLRPHIKLPGVIHVMPDIGVEAGNVASAWDGYVRTLAGIQAYEAKEKERRRIENSRYR